MPDTRDTALLVEAVKIAIRRGVEAANGSTAAVDPGHRRAFHWPPPAISRDYHVTKEHWADESQHVIRGETYTVQWATNDHGIFGRIIDLWNEAKGSSREEVLTRLEEGARPCLDRQDLISKSLGFSTRFNGNLSELESPQLVSLLYCKDRDIAYSALIEIETRASQAHFLSAFELILRDHKHPFRRSAQWCVLDMLEDYSAFCRSDEDIKSSVDAIEDLIMVADDDYARTVYKAGVVLGGHYCNDLAADALFRCLSRAKRPGRRSAMHAAFHLVEWMPEQRTRFVQALRAQADIEPEPLLKEFALHQADDIEMGSSDHVAEPIFEDEIDRVTAV